MLQGVSKSQPAGEQLTASQRPPLQASPQSLVDCDDAGAAGAFPSTVDEACVAAFPCLMECALVIRNVHGLFLTYQYWCGFCGDLLPVAASFAGMLQ